MTHPYFTARARLVLAGGGIDPRNAGPLAEWAETAKQEGRKRSEGVIVAEDGTLHGDTFHSGNASYVRGRTGRNELGLAMGDIRGELGQGVIHVRVSDVCQGHAAPGEDLADAVRLRVVRRGLGVTSEWLAGRMPSRRSRTGVVERTVRKWEAGTIPVPADVWPVLDELLAIQAAHVADGVPDGEDWPDGWREAVEWRRMLGPHAIRPADRYVTVTGREHVDWIGAIEALDQ